MSAPYVTLASVLALSLHSLPGASPAKERRCRAAAWLESASILPGPPLTLILSFLCQWSPCHVSVECDAGALTLRVGQCALALQCPGRAALAAVCDSLNQQLPKPELHNLPSLLGRGIERSARHIWPPPPPPPLPAAPPLFSALDASRRGALEAALVQGVEALGSHRLAAPLGALEGVGLLLSLLVCARGSPKAALICRPVPPWLMSSPGSTVSSSSSSSSGGGAGDGGPFGQTSDVDAAALQAALAGLPSVASLAATWPHCLTLLPLDSCMLLYWLVCLAPVHLVRAASPRLAGATASFFAVHGPPAAAAGSRSSSGGGGAPPASSGRGAFVGGGSALLGPAPPLPLWNASDARSFGVLGGGSQGAAAGSASASSAGAAAAAARIFHGTATDCAFSILEFGLRSLSGTRHETSGSIFGAGVYLSSAVAVAKEFATRKGTVWGGYTCAAVPLEACAGAGGSGTCSVSVQQQQQQQQQQQRRLPPAGADRPSSLRPIFEVQLVRAPSVSFIKEGKAAQAAVGKGGDFVLPEGCYIVVPEASHLHITELHIISDAAPGAGGDRGAGAAAAQGAAGAAAVAAATAAAEGGGAASGRKAWQCCAPWAKWLVTAAVLAYVAHRLGLLGGVTRGLLFAGEGGEGWADASKAARDDTF